jgi:hypothetical protein
MPGACIVMHTMHEYVVDIAVIPVRLQLNVGSEKKVDRPKKLSTSGVKE